MASGSKTDDIFTKTNMGDGASEGIVTKSIGDGQSIKSAYPQDNVHGLSMSDTKGGKFRGSPTNLSHSLTGASAVQDGPGAAGSVKHQRRS